MRTIKFCGKHGDKWLYGDLLQHEDGTCYIYPSSAPDSPDNYTVDPNTVGQFTELFDKDNNEIYDGAIMAIETPISGLYDYRRVQYSDIKGAWIAVTDHTWSYLHEINSEYKVVGNIHDQNNKNEV